MRVRGGVVSRGNCTGVSDPMNVMARYCIDVFSVHLFVLYCGSELECILLEESY